jgi:pyruvate/2-oxoglutarate/acetoin dehydrogenase E1 component/TPP-dependent pyruvate/acetoin dehydrogenase alpha subunit
MADVNTINDETVTAPVLPVEEILSDYRTAYLSRQASLLGRKEVLTGKAKFGIFGDGKEIPQLAMARAFQEGDFRAGYYRDQTFMFAAGMLNVREFFAQLYAHPDVEAEPASAGRSMNGHFATRSLNPDGSWKDLAAMKNSSADVSPTGSQMPRLLGLSYASRIYREIEELKELTGFSRNGEEIGWGTIGNASCAEGMFWEAINAAGVLRVPMIVSIWDDGYGISVPNEFQITKGNLSEILAGFQREAGSRDGFDIYTVKGWDYPALVETYQRAADIARSEHVPAIIHVVEVTQPQGHSTSGSHERYKTAERLEWEKELDGLTRMREWIVGSGVSSEAELDRIEKEGKKLVKDLQKEAWAAYSSPIVSEIASVRAMIDEMAATSPAAADLKRIGDELAGTHDPFRKDIMVAIHSALLATRDESSEPRRKLIAWRDEQETINADRYNSYLHTPINSALDVPASAPEYAGDAPNITGFEVLNACFDATLKRDPRVLAFGEDVGQLGDVNQGFAGLQAKYGPLRVGDTGIRECTILGQAIGLAMRGLRPIAEIQYLDYLLYALQIMSDDLATLQYRTKGGQKAPVIIRTRGHRLEGVWHSGSPMAGIINLVRGIHVLVPRNMTQAAGFYNTLLRSDDPGLVIEVLNAYRLREKLPSNVDTFTVPLGVPEILRGGKDLTVVTYGALCRIALAAAEQLATVGIDVEVIDVQSLLPFDINGMIVESLGRTSRVLFLDEDVPGGATAYMMQEVLERQGGYRMLDSAPRTLAAKPHRPPYGTDGDYFSKPSVEDIFRTIYEMMNEADPAAYPIFWR